MIWYTVSYQILTYKKAKELVPYFLCNVILLSFYSQLIEKHIMYVAWCLVMQLLLVLCHDVHKYTPYLNGTVDTEGKWRVGKKWGGNERRGYVSMQYAKKCCPLWKGDYTWKISKLEFMSINLVILYMCLDILIEQSSWKETNDHYNVCVFDKFANRTALRVAVVTRIFMTRNFNEKERAKRG